MRYILLSFICLNSAVFVSCGQISDPLRNKIVFNNDARQVSDSIMYMDSLLQKLPKNQMLGSFIDNEAYLFVNTKKLGLLKSALYDSSIRSDSVFRNFTDDEYKRFISITIFLLKNNIDASGKDNLTNMFVHGYRRTIEDGYDDIRDIIVNVDTSSVSFITHYQILDRVENMVLVAPKDAKL